MTLLMKNEQLPMEVENGHRICKDHKSNQNGPGLDKTDPKSQNENDECIKGNYLKVDLNSIGIPRENRSFILKSLRANPDIFPITDADHYEDSISSDIMYNVTKSLRSLGVDREVEEIVDKIYELSSILITNIKNKFCEASDPKTISDIHITYKDAKTDISVIVESLFNYINYIIDEVSFNITELCNNNITTEHFLIDKCGYKCLEGYVDTINILMHQSINRMREKEESTVSEKEDTEVSNTLENNNNAREEVKKAKEYVTIVLRAKPSRTTISPYTNLLIMARRNYGVTKLSYNSDISEQDSTSSLEYARKRKPEPADDTEKEKKIQDDNEYYSDVSMQDLESSEEYLTSKDNINKGKKEKFVNVLYSDISKEELKSSEENLRNEKSDKRTEIEKEKKRREELKKKVDKKGLKPKLATLSDKNKKYYDKIKWNNNIVPYIIAGGTNQNGTKNAKLVTAAQITDLRSRLELVNSYLINWTCAELMEIREKEVSKYKDYIVLDTSPDFTYGNVKGKQHFGSLELFKGGQHKQHTAMMVMAMLGFRFETTRTDRDSYIKIYSQRILPDKFHHVMRIQKDATLDLPYDYESATHPSWQFWRKSDTAGLPVITYKFRGREDPDGSKMKMLGQNSSPFSSYDIIRINSIYGTKCFPSAQAIG